MELATDSRGGSEMLAQSSPAEEEGLACVDRLSGEVSLT